MQRNQCDQKWVKSKNRVKVTRFFFFLPLSPWSLRLQTQKKHTLVDNKTLLNTQIKRHGLEVQWENFRSLSRLTAEGHLHSSPILAQSQGSSQLSDRLPSLSWEQTNFFLPQRLSSTRHFLHSSHSIQRSFLGCRTCGVSSVRRFCPRKGSATNALRGDLGQEASCSLT